MSDQSHRRIDLNEAPWLADAATQGVLGCLASAGFGARVVGGAIRNQLLGEPVSDIDIATTAHPREVAVAARQAGFEVIPTGIDHGTVTVVAGGQPFEVTTLRHDVETDGRRARVAFTDDWAADAGRRDFTINALYCDASGSIFDPAGGLADLAARRVRFIGEPTARIREDYLRILRLFRFSARYSGGSIDAAGLAAAVRMQHGLDGLSGERVRAELLRLLVAATAADVIEVMADCGIAGRLTGGIVRPSRLRRLIAVETQLQLVADPIRRLAALTLYIAEDAERLALRLKLSNAERDRLADLAAVAEAVQPSGSWPPSASSLNEDLYRRGQAAVRDRLLLAAIEQEDGAGRHQLAGAITLTQEFRRPVFPLSGRTLIERGMKPGPAIGEALARMEDDWIRSEFKLSAAQLLGDTTSD